MYKTINNNRLIKKIIQIDPQVCQNLATSVNLKQQKFRYKTLFSKIF
jgi:hypothetical protein